MDSIEKLEKLSGVKVWFLSLSLSLSLSWLINFVSLYSNASNLVWIDYFTLQFCHVEIASLIAIII